MTVLVAAYGPVVLGAILLGVGWIIREVRQSRDKLSDRVDHLSGQVIAISERQATLRRDVDHIVRARLP